ncbi:MAG TPA: endonuclease/exonuclease/phosphatase family protein [Kineosporiaceae bacterium]|nr:endonuclease/exonuclease/phosphatase family protein [Kineosporiaceae bacterium]
MTRRTIFRIANLFGVLGAIVAAVPITARALEHGAGAPIPQLAAFAPWGFALWLIAGPLLLIGRRRRAGGAVLLVVVLVALLGVRWMIPSGAARDAARSGVAAGSEVRLMTLNAEFGRADTAHTLALVRGHAVDVLVVEELTPALVERLRAAGLDGLLGYSDLHPRGGAAGTGIWSRWPLQEIGRLPSQGFEMPMVAITLPGTGTPDPPILTVTGIHTRAPHLAATARWRRDLSMIAMVEASRGTTSGPMIYAGDFNASREHAEFRAILDTGLVDAGDALSVAPWPGFTWPADQPGPAATRIDHILITPTSIGVRKVTVVSVPGTDHHGVIADLEVSS